MSLTDYSDIEKEISGAPDPKVLPKGTECRVRIVRVKEGVSTSADYNGVRYIQVGFDVPDDPLVIEFNTFFWDLADKDKLDEKSKARTFSNFKQFAACFGLDYSKPFSWTDDLVGLQGWIIVGIKDDPEYGPKNTVSKYVAGQSKSQPRVATAAGQAVASGVHSGVVDDDSAF